MKRNIRDINGKSVGDVSVSKNVFGIEPNLPVVRQAILSELNNMRQGTHSSKNRAKVSGGGKKPWKQKGRGVARAGTIRSPLWKGGGVVFGPEPHVYNKKLPKKMSKLARKSVLTKKVQNKELIVLDSINISSKKTADFISFMKSINILNKKTLILVDSFQENLILSSRNIRNVFIENVKTVSVYDLLDSEIILIDKAGIDTFSEVLA